MTHCVFSLRRARRPSGHQEHGLHLLEPFNEQSARLHHPFIDYQIISKLAVMLQDRHTWMTYNEGKTRSQRQNMGMLATTSRKSSQTKVLKRWQGQLVRVLQLTERRTDRVIVFLPITLSARINMYL